MPSSYVIKLTPRMVVSGCQRWASWSRLKLVRLPYPGSERTRRRSLQLGEMLHPEIFEAAYFQREGRKNERYLPLSFLSNLQVVFLSWEERCQVLSKAQECYSSRGHLHNAVRFILLT